MYFSCLCEQGKSVLCQSLHFLRWVYELISVVIYLLMLCLKESSVGKYGLHPFYSLLELIVLGTEADAYVSSSVGAEDESWGDEYTSLMQDTLCELFGIVIFIGDSSPEEHTRLMGIILAAQHAHDFLCHRSALAVRTDVGLHVPLLGVVIGLCGSQLQGTEGARIYIALPLQYP